MILMVNWEIVLAIIVCSELSELMINNNIA